MSPWILRWAFKYFVKIFTRRKSYPWMEPIVISSVIWARNFSPRRESTQWRIAKETFINSSLSKVNTSATPISFISSRSNPRIQWQGHSVNRITGLQTCPKPGSAYHSIQVTKMKTWLLVFLSGIFLYSAILFIWHQMEKIINWKEKRGWIKH